MTKIYHANVNVNFIEENVTQSNCGITINVEVSVKTSYMQKNYIWTLVHVVVKDEKYLASIMDDSVILCDETIDTEETKTDPQNITCNPQNFYILLAFLLISIAILIAVSIYYYLIKYWAKQKQLLAFHVSNNEVKQVFYW